MKKRIIETNQAPAAVGPYSQGVVVGDLIYISGQIALTPDGTLVNGSIHEETTQIMKNLKAILETAGVGFDSVVKTTIYITDVASYSEVNATYSEFMTEPYPARECVGIKALPLGAQVEISMIAAV